MYDVLKVQITLAMFLLLLLYKLSVVSEVVVVLTTTVDSPCYCYYCFAVFVVFLVVSTFPAFQWTCRYQMILETIEELAVSGS